MHKLSALVFFFATSLFSGGVAYAVDSGKDSQTQGDQTKPAAKKAVKPQPAAPQAMKSYRSINPPQPSEGSDGGRTDDPIGGLPGNSAPGGDKKP